MQDDISHRTKSSFEIPKNYSILINKLEQLALGLDSALGNFTIDRKEVEISLGSTGNSAVASETEANEDILIGIGSPIAAGRAPPPRITHAVSETEEYSRVVSDIWIGVILTLLIVSVIFFICACFLYHKFQQWKNSYRTNHTEPVEICRRFPTDIEIESLPSYTIVSGLPTYDDALEEFRKAGVLLKSTVVPIIKVFDTDTKESQLYPSNLENAAITEQSLDDSNDNISVSSACTCGAALWTSNIAASSGLPAQIGKPTSPTLQAQIIELSPEHLATLSRKRLSLQIAVGNTISRNSRTRFDLRNNLLRSRVTGTLGNDTAIPRSASVNSLTYERNLLDQHLQHRGSLY